jgi:hypothetical protein
MSFANVVLYVLILGFIVYRRVQGKPVVSAKKLFLLPVVVTVLGYQDLGHKPLSTVDVGFAVAGCGLSLALGALRGSLDKISTRDGSPWVRWGAASVIVFMVNIAAKLVLDVVSVVAGGTSSGATSSLVLAAGLMLLGEAAVIWLRAEASQPRSQANQTAKQQPAWAPPPVRASQPAWGPPPVQAPQPMWSPPARDATWPTETSVPGPRRRGGRGPLHRLADRLSEV